MRRATLAVLILAYALPVSAATPLGGVIRVTATYPGADAPTVDETVCSALFRQISGVEDMTRIESEARNDGTLTLTLYFQPKADLNLAEMRVQNRVNLALARIPGPCRQLGVSVRKFPAGPPVFWLALTGDDNDDEGLLRSYVNVNLRPEFTFIPGVADVRIVGVGETGVRVQVKPDRLAAYQLNAGDVIDALRQQNAPVAAGGSVHGKALQHTVTVAYGLRTLPQFEAVILRANLEGEILRLRDVANVEFGTTMGGFTRVNGKPAALIAVKAWPGKVSADQFRKADGVVDLPRRLRFDVVADRSADHLLTVEVSLPPGTALERTEKVVAEVTDLIHKLPGKGVTSTAVAEGHESNVATILVKVPAKGGPTAADVDKALNAIAGARIRVGDAPAGGEPFPVRIALTEPGEWFLSKQREERFRDIVDRVVMGLVKDRVVAEPAVFPEPTAARQYAIDVDRDKCAMLGVKLNDVFTTLQMALGGVHATDFHRFGQPWKVIVQAGPEFARNVEDLTQFKVRSEGGKMVALETVIKARKVDGPAAVVRVNGYRATIITAAPAAGQTPVEAAARCIKMAERVLPKGYRVKDLTGP